MSRDLTILVADDDRTTTTILKNTLGKQSLTPVIAHDGIQALKILDEQTVDLVIADYQMPGLDGFELLQAMKDRGLDIPFVMVTAHGSVDMTMKAMRLGAIEYLVKPVDPLDIVLLVEKILNINRMKNRLTRLQKEVEKKYHFNNIVGQSPLMQALFESIHKASQSTANVLVTGESGTGKELAAKAVHYNGPLKEGPFVAVNCSAFSSGTLESELFGHVKGAFTDAHRDHMGRFELADKGTLFLDEVGDIPPDIQVKLLRVLQDKTFERVGAQEPIHSDFRLVAATNQDLKDLVRKGKFREDLFYRLNVIAVTTPALREHPQDIPLLIAHFLKRYGQIGSRHIKTLSMNAMKTMQEYRWPGNVRQLENAMESAAAMCEGSMIRTSDLPLELTSPYSETALGNDTYSGTLPEVVERVEKHMILKALEQNQWVKAHAARTLGVSERVVSYKMANYGLSPDKAKPTKL
ncbi:MAG: sigma-54-dependent Fis family transcriptional regulator [Desulfatibacillum sp.]|nr:sigma-54-dependent Fis family transcriptional regulator [Desulfatibacillum sp.]